MQGEAPPRRGIQLDPEDIVDEGSQALEPLTRHDRKGDVVVGLPVRALVLHEVGDQLGLDRRNAAGRAARHPNLLEQCVGIGPPFGSLPYHVACGCDVALGERGNAGRNVWEAHGAP